MRTPAPLVLALLLLGSPAGAQLSPTRDDRSLLGQYVRLRAGAALDEGTIRRLDGDSLSWLSSLHGGTLRTIPRAALDSLWVARRHTPAGLMLGALVGLVPVALSCLPAADECGLLPNGVILVGLTTGLGGLIGNSSRRWQLIVP